ncbi:MAG: hypothetical protein K2L54_03740 [Clostridiales bacterium]|nr:hypothetical protein [Clostridiales bacterium]
MNNYFTVLKAMFKNKLRFGAGKSKRSVIGFLCLLGVVYALVMTALLTLVVELRELLVIPQLAVSFFFFVLMTAALIVLIFGIISLVTTLYLSKDTDFYSVLPIKQTTVFAAKLSFVYIFETAIVMLITLPVIITFGIVIEAWAWYYVISIIMLAAVPSLPLVFAAIIAIPVMFIASKVKNRSIVALIFYMLLFGGFFGVYLYFVFSSVNVSVDPEALEKAYQGIVYVQDAFYPYTALSVASLGIPAYGMSVGASTAINLLIFVGSSAALLAVLMFAAKFMYSQSVKANNQTDNSRAKKGEFKSQSGFKALIKREYLSSLRTAQVAFQCYAVMLLPIIMSVALSVVMRKTSQSINNAPMDALAFDTRFFTMILFCTLAAMIGTLGNAASTTFSREGNAMASLKIMPVDIRRILKAKITAWVAIATPVAAVSVAIVNALNFDWQFMLLSVFSLIPLSVAFIVFGALWDLNAPKLKWTDPSQAIKHNGHVTVGQLLSIAGGLVVMVILFVLFYHDVPMDITLAVCWALIYAILVIFAIADILYYRRVYEY